MSEPATPSHPQPDHFPVSVVMERRVKRRDQWSFVEWHAVGVLSGTDGEAPSRQLIHSDDECQRFRFSGFNVRLHKDDAEAYWNNLMAERPALFVVCREEEEGEEGDDLDPFLVTANYDEIIGYLEVDDQVFSVPLPPDIHHWLERYVVNNYVPPQRKKRKRANWKQHTDDSTPEPSGRH